MFNFFDALKKENLKVDIGNSFNVVFTAGKLLYIEGHKGLLKLEDEIVVIKVKNGVLTIKGSQMFLKDLKKDVVIIQGKINNIEIL